MEVGLFVLGILVGIGVCGYLLERHGAAEADEREANFQARLAAMQSELKDSDFGSGGDQGSADRTAAGAGA